MADIVNKVHVSPGIYATETVDMKTAANSVGVTKLAAVGETIKGPAFQPYWIHSPKEYASVFGGTSTEKFKGSNYPKYELPYIANEYLKKGTELCVVRTLGISGYNAGPAWLITGSKTGDVKKYVIAVLRSRGTYKYRPELEKVDENGCPCNTSNDAITFEVGEKRTVESCEAPIRYNMESVYLSEYNSLLDNGNECTSYELSGTGEGFQASYGNIGRFTINCVVGPTDDASSAEAKHIPVSLNKSDKDYILNVLGTSNSDGDMPLFVETLYDVAWEDMVINQGFNIINQDLVTYEASFVSDYSGLLPINGILTKYEDELKKSDVGKRFLYSTYHGSPEPVFYHEFDYNTELESSRNNLCKNSYIYTVVQSLSSTGKKSYIYKSYSEESIKDLTGDEFIMAQDKLLSESEASGSSKHGMCVYNIEDGLHYKIKLEYSGTTQFSASTIEKKIRMTSWNDINLANAVKFQPDESLTGNILLSGNSSVYDLYEIDTDVQQESATVLPINMQSYNKICINDPTNGVNGMFVIMNIASHRNDNLQIISSSGGTGELAIYESRSSKFEAGTYQKISGTYFVNEKYMGVNTVNINGSDVNTFFNLSSGYSYVAIPIECQYNSCDTGYNYTKNTCKTDYSLYYMTEKDWFYHYKIELTDGVWSGIDKDKYYLLLRKGQTTQTGVSGKTVLNGVSVVNDDVYPITCDLNNYKSQYRYSSTPWVVSNVKGDAQNIELNKLFRFHTISDGAASVNEVKVSIENIRPDSGEFDVIVRSYNDVDASTTVLEAFRKCTMGTGKNSIAYKIGTIDGMYESKSKYITVEVVDSSVARNSVPAGFLGYPIPKYNGDTLIERQHDNVLILPISYNKNYYEDIPKRKQYFGISDIAGYDYDYFTFKGNMATLEDPGFVTNGFHLDARLDMSAYVGNKPNIKVDGVSGYTFDCVGANERTYALNRMPVIASENDMYGSIYEDVKLRKFTMAFAGGFDGWDPYRDQRTNTNEFSQTSYKGYINKRTGEGRNFSSFDGESYGIEGRALTTDYYATLAGVSMLKNPEEVDVNLLVTPGIDTINNTQLVGEVFNILEDRADTFYVVDTPDKYAGSSDYIEDIPDTEEIVYDFTDREIYSDYAATYYPWVKIEDNGEYVWLPATRDVVRNLTESDNTNTTMNLAPAGTTRGRVDAIRARKNLKNSESDELYEANINPVRTYAQEGLVIMGQKTLRQQDDLMNRVDVRRMVLRLRKLIAIGCLGLIFEPNDNNTVKAFKSIISGIMQTFMDNRAIEKWTMDVDDSAEMRDRLELSAVIYIKPIRALEYITLNFVVTNNDVYFDN